MTPHFFDEIFNTLQDIEVEIIMVGKFNIALNSKVDWKGSPPINSHPHALMKIYDMMDALDLIDIWRFKNPKLIRYTWRRQNQASRIGFFLISFALISKVIGVSIENKLGSFNTGKSMWTRILEVKSESSPRWRICWQD